MDQKIGVYVDTGHGIGQALNAEALLTVAKKEFKVPVCRADSYWDDPEKLAIIRNDISNEGLTAVLIAGPSSRVYQDVFKFEGVITERANLREHVIWCQPPKNEDTQMLAEDYLRMYLTKLKKYEDRAPFMEETDKTILVIGGGISGMTAALEASKAGYQVVLVEKGPQLGGWAAKFSKVFTGKPPYDELVEPPIKEKVAAITGSDKIKVFTGSRVYSISGAPGMFDVIIRAAGPWTGEQQDTQNKWLEKRLAQLAMEAQGIDVKEEDRAGQPPKIDIDTLDFTFDKVRVGAVVVAAGWRPEDPAKYEGLGYGKYPDVITNVQMEEMAAAGKLTRPSDGKAVNSVAFIDAVEPGAANPFLYSSTVSCMVALKQARYLRKVNPAGKAYLFYENMRTPGQYEKYYQTMQDDPGVFLSKGSVTGVSNGSGQMSVEVADTLLGGNIKVNVDMVVLSTGMVSTLVDESVVNLNYRQGPFIPQNPYGQYDSHFICFPYETLRTGIYTTGCVRQPQDMQGCELDAAGAALKAIQCVELVAQGKAVHPRVGDQSYPELFITRCTQCKRCTEECPFGMYDEKPDGTPLPNPTRCRRCAICMGSCPERIISFRDHNVDMIGSMVKSINVPDAEDEKPRVLVFICENDAFPAIDMAGINRLQYSPFVRFIPLRCLGNINLVWIADSLSKGIDGIMLIGCKFGDDYQCHFVKGSELAKVRMSKISETLQRLALESERIEVHQLTIDEYQKIPEIINKFVEVLSGFEPNPYKAGKEKQHMSNQVVVEPDLKFTEDLIKAGAGDLKKCFQCATCSVACRVSPDNNPYPRKEMIWAQWGLKDRLMSDPDVWLCHQCNDCSTKCPRGAYPGDVLKAARKMHIQESAWPGFLGKLVGEPALFVLAMGIPVVLVLLMVFVLNHGLEFPKPTSEYRVHYGEFIKYIHVQLFFTAALAFGVISLLLSLKNYWNKLEASNPAAAAGPRKGFVPSLIEALSEILPHTTFKDCDANNIRYSAHLLTFWGMLGLVVTTAIVAGIVDIPHYLLGGAEGIPPSRSGPGAIPIKLLGNVSALAFLIGLTIMLVRRLTVPEQAGKSAYFDWFFLFTICGTGITGLATELVRFGGSVGGAYVLYMIHLMFVLSLFLYLPYSKFAHLGYRTVAIAWGKSVGRNMTLPAKANYVPAPAPE